MTVLMQIEVGILNTPMHDTEDKKWWVKKYLDKEKEFVLLCENLGIKACINPEKTHNPYAPDLIINGVVSDLKYQETPFFKALLLYDIDPTYAVTFNRKDFLRYQTLYPDIDIYFWLKWRITEKEINQRRYRVDKVEGVWRINFFKLGNLIKSGIVYLHNYHRRQSDRAGNAKNSYVFDVRYFDELMFQHV